MLMKAKEYFEKYGTRLADPKESTNAAIEMFMEMADEVTKIAEQRHAKTDRAVISIIHEINDRWNAVASMIEKTPSVNVLIRNGFLKFWEENVDLNQR